MTAKIPMKAAQAQSAACRAMILSSLPKLEPMAQTGLFAALAGNLPEGYKPSQFQTVLYGLVKNGLVAYITSENGRLYGTPGANVVPRVTSQDDAPGRKTRKPRAAQPGQVLDITVGRSGDYAEISLKGLRIRLTIGE